MKKITAIILSMLFILAVLAGCGSSSAPNTETSEATNAETTPVETVETTPEPTPEPSPEIDLEAYKEECEEVKYTKLARNPDEYIGKKIKVTIEINQLLEDSEHGENGYRGYEDWKLSGKTFYTKHWFIKYKLNEGESRILENDVVTFYGTFYGLYTYETIMGDDNTVIALIAVTHEIVKEAD